MRVSPLLLAVAAHALAPLPRAKNLGRRGAVVSEPETKSGARSYADLTIGVVAESDPTENRVAQTPESLSLLVKAGFNAKVASNAGAAAGFADDMYKAIGAQITTEDDAWASDIVTKIAPPTSAEASKIGDRAILSRTQCGHAPAPDVDGVIRTQVHDPAPAERGADAAAAGPGLDGLRDGLHP